MLSRRTIIWLVIALISTAILTYRVMDFQRTCRAYGAAHTYKANKAEPPSKPEDTVYFNYDPCAYEDPSPIDEKILTLIAIVSVPVSLVRSIRDLYGHSKRKQGSP